MDQSYVKAFTVELNPPPPHNTVCTSKCLMTLSLIPSLWANVLAYEHGVFYIQKQLG